LGLASWLAFTALGLLLINLDSGPKIVSLVSGHGLKALDVVGGAALSVGWIALVVSGRRQFALSRAPRPVMGNIAVLGSGFGLLATSLLAPDFSGRGFVVAGFLLVFQTAAALTVFARCPFAPCRGLTLRRLTLRRSSHER